MSGSDGALITRLNDLQSRLTRVASLAPAVELNVASVLSRPEFANWSMPEFAKLKHHDDTLHPRSPLPPSPSLQGRAAYFRDHDVVPRRGKKQLHLKAPGPLTIGETAHSPWAKQLHSSGFQSPGDAHNPEPHSTLTTPRRKANDTYVFRESPVVGVLSNAQGDAHYDNLSSHPPSPSVVSANASSLAELDNTRARLVASEIHLAAASRAVEVLQSKLALAETRETEMARTVAGVVADAERIVEMARRTNVIQREQPGDEKLVTARSADDGGNGSICETFHSNDVDPRWSRAAAVRVAVAEAVGEAKRLCAEFWIPKTETEGLFQKLKEISAGVSEVAAFPGAH